MPVLAVIVLVITACGDSKDDNDTTTSDTSDESTIISHMNLESHDSGWTFSTDAGETCVVQQVLTTPADVQTRENAGDVVAVNSAGSLGVVLPAEITDSCHDTAIELLSEL